VPLISESVLFTQEICTTINSDKDNHPFSYEEVEDFPWQYIVEEEDSNNDLYGSPNYQLSVSYLNLEL